MKPLLFVFLFAVTGTLSLHAQLSPLQTGYDLLVTNQPAEARDYFKSQLAGPNAGDAAVALSFSEMLLMNSVAATEAFARFIELEGSDIRRNAYTDALWSTTGELSELEYEMTEGQLDNPYTRLRPLALYTLGNHYYNTGDQKESREYFNAIGVVAPWQVVGPFENTSESGFDRDFGVLDRPQSDATFTNKLGIPVGWVPVEQVGRQGWLHLGNHFNIYNSITYAQTFCESDKAQEVVFRLGSSGSVKVWVNDREVFTEFHERDNHLDTYIFAAPLQAGKNRILIQIGTSEGGGANFLLRITDEQGRLIPSLSFDNEPSAYRKQGEWEQEVYANPTVDYFKARMVNGQAHYIDYLSLIQYYRTNGFKEEARELLYEALGHYPDNHFLIASLIPTLRAMDDDAAASELEQQLVQDAPDFIHSLEKRMTDALKVEDWPAYETALSTYKQRYGESEATLLGEIGLAGGRKETEKIIELVDRGLKLYPTNTDLLIGKAGIESGVRNSPASATKLLEKFLKKHYRENVVEELIDLRFKAGEGDEAIDLFEMLVEREPTNTNLYSRMSRLYYLMGNYRESQRMLDKALELAPYLGSLHSSLAAIYAEAGDKDKAQTAYEKALSLDPYDYESRDALRMLRSEAVSAFTVLDEPDYYQLYADSKGQEAYPDDHSVVLSYDVQQIVHEGGASETRSTVLIKALTDDGVDAWKEYNIPIYNQQKGVVEKVEVLDPDGSRHEASRSGTDIVFDRLQPGGAIYLVYRIQDYKYGRLSGKFWNDHLLSLALPSVQSTYSLLVPKGTKFTYEVTGMHHTDIEPVRSQVDNRDLYVWQLRDQPGVRPEAITPDYSDILTTVRVSNIDDWAYIAQWYSELTHAKVRVDDYVRRAVTDLFEDAPTGLTERQQVERIYSFVTGNIRYISVPFLQSNYIPQSAAKTLATRQGDCKDVSSLFVAMCDVRGIDANLVLINTRDRSRLDLTLPGTGFNHCIARVELEETPYYVELTDENLPFGTGDWSVNGAFALDIPRRGEAFDGQSGPINPASRGVNSVIRTGQITFEGNDLVFDYHNRKTNSAASSFRSTYRNESEENRKRTMQEAISGDYPRTELLALTFDEGLQDRSLSEVGYDYRYRVSDPSTKVGGMKIFPIVLSDKMEAPPYTATATRELPIDLWRTFQAEYYEQTIEVVTPAGQTLVEVPGSIAVSNEFIDYRMEYVATDRGLQIKRSIQLKRDMVQPEHYVSFRDDMLKIVEADEVNLAYRAQ